MRQMTLRRLVLSLAVYIFGMSATIYGADDDMFRYVGFGLISVGSIALAAAAYDTVIAALSDLRIAVVLAILGVVAYVIWVNVSPLN